MSVSCFASACDGRYAAEQYAAAFEGRDDEVPVSMIICCWGSSISGLDRCSCWKPEYDAEQVEPRPRASATSMAQCVDCAFLPGSPEQQSPEDAELLDELALCGERFWCHQGMRRVVLWRHPSGATIPGHADEYAPLCRDGVAYRADGQPADLCRGWARARRVHEAEAST